MYYYLFRLDNIDKYIECKTSKYKAYGLIKKENPNSFVKYIGKVLSIKGKYACRLPLFYSGYASNIGFKYTTGNMYSHTLKKWIRKNNYPFTNCSWQEFIINKINDCAKNNAYNNKMIGLVSIF